MRFLRDNDERPGAARDDARACGSETGWTETDGGDPGAVAGDASAGTCLNGLERDECGADGLCSVILDVVGALVVVLDHDGRIVRFNRACEETTGYSFEEVAGAKVWERLLMPEDAGPVEEVFTSLRSGEYPNSHENYWLTKDGRKRIISWSNTAIPNSDGSVRYVIATGIDVTDRQDAEDGVRWRTEDLTLLNTLNESANRGDSMADIAHLLSLGTKRDFASYGASLYLLDDSRSHLVIQSMSVHANMIEPIEKLAQAQLPDAISIRVEDSAYYRKALKSRSTVVVTEAGEITKLIAEFVEAVEMSRAAKTAVRGLTSVLRKTFGIHGVAIVPLVSEGEPVGVMELIATETLTDIQIGRLTTIARQLAGIVRRRRAEESLRLSEATLADAQRIARIGNWSWDLATDERHWSDEIYKIFGRTVGEFAPTYDNFIEVVHPDDRQLVKGRLERALHTGRRYSVDHRIVLPDDSVRVVHEQGAFTLDENGKPMRMVGTVQDVTKQTHAKEVQSVILTIAEAVNKSDSLQELLATIHQEMGRLIDTTNFYVALFDEATGNYTFPYHIDKYDDAEELGPTYLGKSLTDYVRRKGEATLVDEDLYQELINAGEVEVIGAPSTSWLGVPLKSGGEDIGVVAVQSYDNIAPYDMNDVRLMTFVSDNIAMAVGRKLAEEQVRRRLNMEETVSDMVSRLIGHSIDETDEAVEEALASAGELLGVEHSFVYLGEASDGNSGDTYEWCADRVPPLIYEISDVAGKCFPWLTEAMQQPGFVRADGPEDVPPEAGALRHFLESSDAGSMVAVPMRNRDQTIGMVGVLGRPNGPASLESVTFLRTVSAALASALERRRVDAVLRSSFESLRATVTGTVDALSRLGEARDPYTAGHQQRVADIACAIAKEMGFPEERVEGIRVASKLHDIGKIHVPGEILSKPGALDELEFGIIKTHPKVGHGILQAVEFPWPVAEVALQHHERLDGSGYPDGISGDEILPESRIVAVADVVEAMSTHRPYRPALPISAAIEELSTNRGKLYGPTAVDACLKLLRAGKLDLSAK